MLGRVNVGLCAAREMIYIPGWQRITTTGNGNRVRDPVTWPLFYLGRRKLLWHFGKENP